MHLQLKLAQRHCLDEVIGCKEAITVRSSPTESPAAAPSYRQSWQPRSLSQPAAPCCAAHPPSHCTVRTNMAHALRPAVAYLPSTTLKSCHATHCMLCCGCCASTQQGLLSQFTVPVPTKETPSRSALVFQQDVCVHYSTPSQRCPPLHKPQFCEQPVKVEIQSSPGRNHVC